MTPPRTLPGCATCGRYPREHTSVWLSHPYNLNGGNFR